MTQHGSGSSLQPRFRASFARSFLGQRFHVFGPEATEEELRAGFEAEATPHLPEIYRAAVHLTRKVAEAEDLTQETFLQAWKSFRRYEPGTNARAWLYRILWNCNHERLRKRPESQLSEEQEERLAETLVARDTTSTEVTDEQILGALATLAAAAREIILLSDVQGFTYKEIAGVLAIPVGTVMSRLSRARAALRAALAGAPGEMPYSKERSDERTTQPGAGGRRTSRGPIQDQGYHSLDTRPLPLAPATAAVPAPHDADVAEGLLIEARR